MGPATTSSSFDGSRHWRPGTSVDATFAKTRLEHSERGRPSRSAQAAATTRFVLLSTQRSGTSWVMERLARHERIGGYGEVLLHGVAGWSDWPPGAADRPFFTTYLRESATSESLLSRHLRLFGYLDYLFQARRGYHAIGFKLMYDQLQRYPEILAYLRVRRVRVLHLFRLNLLDIVLSREAMKSRRNVHARSPAEREMVRVEVDTRRLVSNLARLDCERRLVREALTLLHIPVVELTYEYLLADESRLRDAAGFLGVDVDATTDMSAVMLKLAPSSHRAGIANYDEVRAALQRTRYFSFLHD